jgi:hypothetical protein
VLWVIFVDLLHRYFGPSDVLADLRHGGVKGAHVGSLCLSRGRSKEGVKDSFLCFLYGFDPPAPASVFSEGFGAGSSSILLPSLDFFSLSAFPFPRGLGRWVRL